MVRICALKWIQVQNLLRAKSTFKRIMDEYQAGLENDVSEICLGNGHSAPYHPHHHILLYVTHQTFASILFFYLFCQT